MSLSRLFKYIFNAPYALLPGVVFAYVAICFLLHPFSPLHTGTLSDPDDYMRLNQTINWLQTQSWYDLSHPRLDPGMHTVVHWARLVDLPIALFMLPFVNGMGVVHAALIASFIVPLLLLCMLLRLTPALARTFVTEDRANVASVLPLFAPMLLFNFTPGRVDHHGYGILIVGFSLVCLDFMIRGKGNRRFALYAAIAYACGLWIGAEILPWLIVFIACFAVLAAWQGGETLRNAALFGTALVIASAICLLLAVPPNDYFKPALSWFSFTDVLFTLLASVVFVGVWAGERLFKANRQLRLEITGVLGLLMTAAFFYLAPFAWRGAFADYDDFNSTIALANITEAQPLIRMLIIDPHNPLTYMPVLVNFCRFLALPLAALGTVAHNVWAGDRRRRPMQITHGVFLLASMLLAFFWQARVGWFMQLFAIAPLTGLLWSLWDDVKDACRGRARLWAEIGVFVLLGPLPIVLLPATVRDAAFYSDVLLFPAAHKADACNPKPPAEFLADPHGYGIRPRTILSGSEEGPELLFRTPHNVLAANFNVPGNRDVYDFFNAHDEDTARDILQRNHADLILVCTSISPFYAGRDHPQLGKNVFLRRGKDGLLHLGGDPEHPAMIDRLVNGTPPAWLKAIEIPGVSDYLLFDVENEK